MSNGQTRAKRGEVIRIDDIRDALDRRFKVVGSLPLERIDGSVPAEQQAVAIERNYEIFSHRVDAGVDTWSGSCPYEVADWAAILTPVEFGAWQDIRSAGLPLWPRLPVGQFAVTFGNPVAKVALQCGDSGESQRVGHWLTQTGWRVFRATAAQCTRVMEAPADVRERTGEEVRAEYRARYLSETLAGTIQDLRHALIAAGARQ